MGEKKSVNRRIAFGIGLLCIALLIITGIMVANYTSALSSKGNQITNDQNQIDMLKNQNANLQSQVSTDNPTISSFNSTISSDNATISSIKTESSNLQTQVSNQSSTLTQLQNQLASCQTELASDNSEINSLNQEIESLQTQNPPSEPGVDGFSVIQVTDTQYLSDSDPALFNGLTSWIVNNSQALNLTMVIHTGDIVQDANSAADWSNANNAMMQLYNNGIPYCWNAGNHDTFYSDGNIGDGSPNAGWIGENYPAFNVTVMRQQPYWAGDINDGKDTAVQFTYGNYHFMVINIEYDANQTVLDWMETLLQCNPNVNVIVATHNFLNGYGGYGYTANPTDVAWATNFENLLNNYPNVFMTVNGHDINNGGTAYNVRVGNREEIFFNAQELDNQQGAADARIYTFNMSDLANPVVNVYTYQTYGTPQYLTDSWDQFSFSASLIPYSPANSSIVANTPFLGAIGNSVSFDSLITINGFSQNGDVLTFSNLTLNEVTSNFTVTSVGADMVINYFNLNSSISYTVDGSGSQTLSLVNLPSSVYIDGSSPLNENGWSYSDGEITVTGATSSAVINFS